MKKITIATILFSYCLISVSQIGVNTLNPLGALHLDTGKNNPATGTPSAAQQLDDVAVVTSSVNSDALVGIGKIPLKTSSAQLELAATNKAILFNNAPLTSATDIVTVPNPIESTVVYSMNNAGAFPNNVVPALTYWNGARWTRFETKTKTSVTNIRLLQTQTSTNGSVLCASYADAKAKALSGALNQENFGNMTVTEQGSYTFALRLYGYSVNRSYPNQTQLFDRSQFFVFLCKKTSAGVVTVLDQIFVNAVMTQANDALTYTGILRGQLNAGDQALIRTGHMGQFSWLLVAVPGSQDAARTTLVFWK